MPVNYTLRIWILGVVFTGSGVNQFFSLRWLPISAHRIVPPVAKLLG